MVGRDIGATVLPDAGLKIYLDASLAVRARRRYDELRARGEPVALADVQAMLERRDQLDTERAASPLRPAADAIRIDTDALDIEAVLARILALLPAAT
jgi:cytidylate kinase